MRLALLGFECARPLAAWAFLLAPLFCWLVRAVARPPEVVIGTLSLWLRGPQPAASAARARGALPPWAWFCAGGLVLGALAWAGPRRSAPVAPGRWTCVLDRSPSMALPLADGRSRLEAALAAAESWLAAHAAREDRVSWTAAARARLELARDERPPPEWLAPAREAQREPEWSGFDQPGTLWLTDRAPAVARQHAGLFASGGPAVAGAIHADGRETLRWSADGLVREPTAPPLTIELRVPPGAHLPAVLERVLDAWCEARGLERVRAPAPDALFVVELASPNDDGEPLELARDGWRARGVASALDSTLAAGAGDDWLSASDASGAARVVVRARPGWIGVGLSALEEPQGDPARFALSWARLFERCALSAPGVVSLAERQAAGEACSFAPEAPLDEARAGPSTVDAWLALGALLCAALALLLRA